MAQRILIAQRDGRGTGYVGVSLPETNTWLWHNLGGKLQKHRSFLRNWRVSEVRPIFVLIIISLNFLHYS